MAITSSYGLNPLQTLKQKAKQSRFGYDDAAANRFSAQGQLYTYLSSLDKVGKTQEDWQNFLNTYKMYDYMPDDYKDFALMNEAQYKPNNYTEEQLQNLSDEEKKLYNEQTKKSLRTWTDENGQEVSQEMTDYEWNKKLLGWKGEEIHQEQLKQQFEEMQANKGWLQKAWEKTIATDVSILRNIVGGAFDALGDLYNLLEGAYAAIYAGATGGDIEEYWREAVGTNELAFIGEAMERATFDWDREMGIRDYYGNKSWLGNMADGISNSFGRMLPTMLISWGGGQIIAARAAGTATALGSTMLNAVDGTSKAMSALSKTSQLLFYASMAQNDITEMLNDEKTASLPSWQIFASAYAGAGMELLVEKGLDKLLGTSVIDAMTYGFNASSKGTLAKAGKDIGKLTKGKVARTVLGRMAFDAFHEGMEEVLQDWSHTFVNGFFETMNYAMGNTEYVNIFHDANTFSLQTAIDSFISGAVMSIIGSGFDYIKTKRLGVSSIKTDKEGNIVTDRKGNIKTEKLSKARSWLYKDAMASIDANVNELLTSGKLTAEEKADLVNGLNTSMKTISAIFEGMGQERFAYANKLLQSMSDVLSVKRATSAVYEFVEGTWSDYGVRHLEKVAEKIEQRQLDNPKYNVSRESNLDEVKEVTATEKDTIKQIFADCEKVNNIIATDNGTGAVLTDDGTLIVPAAQLQNLDPATIEKDINEQVMVSNITKVPQLKLVIDQIYKMFKELPINKGKKFTKETAITYLLLNPDFAKVCLYTGDVNMVQFISQLDKLVKSLEVSDALTSQHKKMLDDSIDTLKTIYADYCIAMQYADINVDILSDEQRQRITRERWNKDLANRIDQGLKLTDGDKRNLENRINSLTVSEEKKAQLREDLFVKDLEGENKTKRDRAFKELAELQYGQFYSLFDDVTYPKSRTLPNITLYNFLRSQGITLQDLRNNRIITIDGQDYKARDYYSEQFSIYTDGVYSLSYKSTQDVKIGDLVVNQKPGFSVEVIETAPSQYGTVEKGYAAKRTEYNKVKSSTDVRSADTNFDRGILKSDINSAYKDMIGIDDVIHTPSMLTDDIREQIKKEYGSLSPNNVYQFLQHKFLVDSDGNRSIGITSEGNFVMVDLVQSKKMLSRKLSETAEDIRTDVLNERRTGDIPSYTIGDFINSNFLKRAEDKAINVEVKNEPNHYYDANTNTIVLSLKTLQNAAAHYSDADFALIVQSAVLHEFTHAIQTHNDMSTGADANIVADLSKKNIDKIANDIKKHVTIKDTVTADLISDILYFNTGEASAYGYMYDFEYNNIPIIAKSSGSEIIYQMPWGIEYHINTSDRTVRLVDTTNIEVSKKETAKAKPADKQQKQLSREGENKTDTESELKEKSESYEMTKEEYAEYQKVKAQNAKKLKQAYKKRTYVSKKREQDTNLAPYAGSRMSSDLQNVIRLTTGKEKYYDKKFIEKVKNGELRTKADVYEYVRKNDMNENTFDLLNKHYFHNQNIASAKQLDQLVEQSARFYALRAAIRSLSDAYDIDVSNYMYGQLNTTMLNQLLIKLKNEAPNAYKIYQDVLSRYQGYRSKSVQDFLSQDLSKMTAEEKADYEKKKKAIESTETKQTQVNTELLKVAYLVGYDGTLEGAGRVANWARQLALTPELKRIGEVSTISMEKQVKDTKGDNLTLGERIAEQYSFENDFDDFPFANDDVKSMAQELYQSKFAEYLNRLVGKENVNLASKELQAILKKKGIDYKIVLAEKQRILDEVSNLSTVEVVEQYKSMELTEVFGVNVKVRADLQRQLTQKANRIMDRLKNKKKAYQALVEQFPELGFTTDKEWHMPRKDGKLLNQDEMYVLSKQLSQVLQYANKGAFDPIVQAQKQQIVKQQEMIAALKKKQADLQRELKLTKQARKNTYERTEDINFNTTEFTMKSTKPMPEKFKQVLDTVFTKLAKTKGKFTNVNEYHTVKNYDEWVDANIETLSQIDTYEANDILDYLLNSTPLYAKYGSDDYVQYRAISMFMTSYLYARQTELNIDKNLLIQAEEMFDNTRSAAGTLMKVSQGLMDKIDVTGKIMKMLSKQSGVDFRPSDLDDLAHIVDKYKDAKTEAEIKEAMNAYKAQYAKMSKRLLRDYKNSDRRTLLNKLVSFQKMAMLSSPGTWIRNITSNFIIQKFDAPMAKLGDFFFNKVAKIADKWDSVGKSKVKKPEFDTTKYSEGLDIATDRYGFEVDYAEGSEFAKWEASVVASIKKAIKWRNDALDVKNAKGDMARYYTEQYHKTQDRIIDLKRYLQGDLTVVNVTEEELNKRTNKVEEVEKSKAVYEGSDLSATDRFKLTARLAEAQRLAFMYANPDAIIAESTKAIEAMEEYKIYAKQMQKYEAKVKGNPLRRTLKGQYKLVGTKVDAETAAFVQSMVIDSGLFDLIKDGLNKYNPSTAGNTTETKITRLIMESVMNNVFMNNQFDTKTMNTMSRLLFKVLSDEKWINKTFVSYLGKMLVEDKVDLTQGYSDKVMQTIADAYSYAAYTYMHKANFVNDFEKALKQRLGDKAFFVYKQIFPFANASINWWIEGLNWTPVGLVKAIKNIVNFDNYVGKMESNYALGRGPSQRFASYEIKRAIGKGIVGTAGFFFAAFAAAFGLFRLEEDDYGDLKIAIGAGDAEIQIDFTEVTGTSGFGWGLVIGNAFKDDEGFDIIKSALNYMFDSSIFSDVYDMTTYNDTFAEFLLEQPERIVKSFIPNIFQVFNSSLYARQIKYNSGALGMLERCAVKMIPGLAYAMPTKYDIYTGELQYKYYPNAMGWIADTISRLGPVKISTAKMSSMERTAMKYGVRRGQLKGDYKDTGKFNTKQVAKLNEMYGSLNKTTLADLVNNKKKYRIQDNKTGKYVEKYYSAMTDEERGTIINRIMSENSTYAKIYVWTSEGHKYYTTSSEYTTLAKLGITKNVYRTSNSKQLMNKFVK